MSGFIKLRRGLKGHWIEKDGVTLAVFVHILLNANWEDRVRVIGGVTVEQQRGEFSTSIRQIADHLGFARSTVKRRIEALKNDGVLGQRRVGKYTAFSIIKYDTGEDGEPQGSHKRAGEYTAECTGKEPLHKNKRNKEVKNKRKKELPLFPPRASEQFKASVQEWLTYRKELKKPLPPATVSKLIEKWIDNSERFAKAVDHTIQMGWQGLREPAPEKHAKPQPNLNRQQEISNSLKQKILNRRNYHGSENTDRGSVPLPGELL